MDLGFGESAAKRPRLDGGGGEMSEVDILRKVAQREMFRQTRKFAESDAIRQELRDAGVELYDKEREWRSKDGRRGVLFTAGPDESPLGDADIQERIREREEARRQAEEAAALRLVEEAERIGTRLAEQRLLEAKAAEEQAKVAEAEAKAAAAAAIEHAHRTSELAREQMERSETRAVEAIHEAETWAEARAAVAIEDAESKAALAMAKLARATADLDPDAAPPLEASARETRQADNFQRIQERVARIKAELESRKSASLRGTMGHAPQQEALRWLLERETALEMTAESVSQSEGASLSDGHLTPVMVRPMATSPQPVALKGSSERERAGSQRRLSHDRTDAHLPQSTTPVKAFRKSRWNRLPRLVRVVRGGASRSAAPPAPASVPQSHDVTWL